VITTSYEVVTPAYGRDYTSKGAAVASFTKGDDWVLQSMQHGQGLISIKDFAPGVTVNLRFARMTKVVPVKVENR
jgi:hypothetical protein